MRAKTFFVAALTVVSVFCISTFAQQPAPQPQSPNETVATTPVAEASVMKPAAEPTNAPVPSAPRKFTLKEGTAVKLKTVKDLSSKSCTTGDAVDMVLDEDVRVGDVVVVPKGAVALATVSNAKKAGAFGRGGELNLRLEYVKAGDTKLRIRGAQAQQGKGKEGAVVALTVAFGPVGFLKHGKQAEVKAGTPIDAVVDQDTEIALN